MIRVDSFREVLICTVGDDMRRVMDNLGNIRGNYPHIPIKLHHFETRGMMTPLHSCVLWSSLSSCQRQFVDLYCQITDGRPALRRSRREGWQPSALLGSILKDSTINDHYTQNFR